MIDVELSPAARRELLDARAFYCAVTMQLGERFASTIDAALRRIAASPTTWPRVSTRQRRYVVSAFPYAIIYRVENDRVLVTAIAHQRRRFGYWRGR
ncbi:MAG TPA: type II toxin-antitoxin system RelE/ParE family toxin [Burkholderiaceae bacterium]|nr:type II toxin-antitoxin system RelE/ParE family toxin [Burkholderiaceae bacterium]HRP28249.1 type II toxin-antitoxin system RelE/ParE family toxin [Burkholderiaceae bacterium]